MNAVVKPSTLIPEGPATCGSKPNPTLVDPLGIVTVAIAIMVVVDAPSGVVQLSSEYSVPLYAASVTAMSWGTPVDLLTQSSG